MNINLLPLIVLWGMMAVAVLALLVWRKSVASQEDDQLHVLSDATAVPHQAAVAQKLDVIDRWGKIVTAVTVAFGVVIAVLFLYQTWTQTSTTIPGA